MDGSSIALFAVNSFGGFRDLDNARCACVDWRSFVQLLPAARALLRDIALQVGYATEGSGERAQDTWPLVDGSVRPHMMFADSTRDLLQRIEALPNGPAKVFLVNDFFVAWDTVIGALPISKAVEVQERGISLLTRMLFFMHSSELRYFEDMFMSLAIKFIKRIGSNSALLTSPTDLGPRGFTGFGIGSVAPVMWLCLRGKKQGRNRRSTYNGNRDFLAELPHDVLETCFVPSHIIPDFRDNILQYILEPVSPLHSFDKSLEEAHLCQVVAQRFGLADHIHRNRVGVCALSYAEQFVHNTGPSRHGGAWVRVRDTITEKMLEGCRDLGNMPGEDSFLVLTYVVRELSGALMSARDYYYEDLSEQSHLRRVLASFEAAEQKRAEHIRTQWAARGWRFARRGAAEQIAEVTQHYKGVRDRLDADNVRRCREVFFDVQNVATPSPDIINGQRIASQGVEHLDGERQGPVPGQTADAVTEHVEHSEPAAMPLANDAQYRFARQQLIIDEEWAQSRTRQINDPKSDDVADGNPEQDVHLRILEFSRAPKAFHDALDNDDDLNACTAALHQEGYIPSGGARIFVDPSEYRKAVPHALGLQSRHVVASERYVEIVLAAVRGIKGRNKVHEKREKRREIAAGSPVEVTGLVSNSELNGHSGTVLHYVQSRARWAVRMIADAREILVLPKNLRLGDNVLLVKNTFILIPSRSVASVSVRALTV